MAHSGIRIRLLGLAIVGLFMIRRLISWSSCDGTFKENCDPSRAYTDIPSLLTSQGASDTLSFIQEFWRNINGDDEELWEHEWSTHGTCMNTLEPSCLPQGSPRGAEAVAFFKTVVKLFKTLPTYTWLASQGITPSSTATYTLAQLTSALTTASGGFAPALQCSGNNLNAISWFFNLRGSIIDGTFEPIRAAASSTCPATGIKYPLKTNSSPTNTATTTTPKPTTTGIPVPGRANIQAVLSSSGSTVGGLLTAGTWSTQTLATYTLAGTPSDFTLTSSKGACGVSGGKLTCGSGVSSTKFSVMTSGSRFLVASGGETVFSSDGVPSGQTVFDVFVGSGHMSHIEVDSQGCTLVISDSAPILDDCNIGDSIATNGCCLTVTEFDRNEKGGWFKVWLANETLERSDLGAVHTSVKIRGCLFAAVGERKVGDQLNLERAMGTHTRFGGHFVQGHVDGTATIVSRTEDGDSLRLRFQLEQPTPNRPTLLPYLIEKGFVAIDGTSLTITEVNDEERTFGIMLIQHTQEKITLAKKPVGAKVNIEVDMVGKYVEKGVLAAMSGSGGSTMRAMVEKVVEDVLARKGLK
ncbi:hypothetical protein V5O48_000959 [Marasmius crinis-equi]|uniref:ribonuclease T2 n=1 Tax=Marasmius crinis-equi TaxID=585013 RepID=A0ABR3FZT2_9AGAR